MDTLTFNHKALVFSAARATRTPFTPVLAASSRGHLGRRHGLLGCRTHRRSRCAGHRHIRCRQHQRRLRRARQPALLAGSALAPARQPQRRVLRFLRWRASDTSSGSPSGEGEIGGDGGGGCAAGARLASATAPDGAARRGWCWRGQQRRPGQDRGGEAGAAARRPCRAGITAWVGWAQQAALSRCLEAAGSILIAT